MKFCNQVFAAAAACTLVVSVIPSNLAAQQTTKDGMNFDPAKFLPPES